MFKNNEVIRTSNVSLPRDLYKVRCMEATFSLSKASQKPMITLDCEVVSLRDGTEIIEEADGKKAKIAGTKFRMFLSLTEKAIGSVFDFTEVVTGQPCETIDDENPDTSIYKGREWLQFLWSKEEVRLDSTGKPILNAQGVPLKGPSQIQASLNEAVSLV